MPKITGTPGCFVLDGDNSNPRALKTEVIWNPEVKRIETRFTPDPTWAGFEGVVHGGLLAAIADETMAWAIEREHGKWAYTGELRLRFLRPVPIGLPCLALGWVDAVEGRKFMTKCEIYSSGRELCVKADSVFIHLPELKG